MRIDDIGKYYKNQLLENGFQENASIEVCRPVGKLFRAPQNKGEGIYWVFAHKDLFAIKIHDFYFFEDTLIKLEMPECLSIIYYDSVSGEEVMPYRRITAGCVKSYIWSNQHYKAIFHKNIPIRTIGIEIMPAYYEKYLKEAYPDEYIAPHEAFRNINQTNHFPEMIALMRQILNYHGNGIGAKLFYEAKVAEAVSLIVEHNRVQKKANSVKISAQDTKLINDTAAYINDHFNCDISLECLSRIACMGTTKLKLSFKQIYDCTITEYIQQRRLSHGEMLLSATNFTIEQIAQTVGYSNPGRFAKAFRKSTGLYPSEYRKRARGEM